MSQQPKTETDRLANVIQVLQLGQKTGRLIVERNDGQRLEQGTITFVNGQVVQASVNQQQGPEALTWLKSWGHCRFAFAPDARPGFTGRTPAVLPQAPLTTQSQPDYGNGRNFTSSLRNGTGGLPYPQQDTSYNRAIRNSGGLQPPQQNIPQRSLGNSGGLQPPQQDFSQRMTDNSGRLQTPQQDFSQRMNGNSGRLQTPQQDFSQRMNGNSGRLQPPQQDFSQRMNGNSGKLQTPQQEISNRTTGNLGWQPATNPTTWLAIPYRSRQMEEGMRLIEHMGLSRVHRRLFLLIDGRRTVKELVRLMAHEPGEILKLLQDLERAGVIQM